MISNKSNIHKYKNQTNGYLDIRAGSDDSLITESFGIGYYTYDGTLYKAINELGTKGYNIL